MDDMSDEQVIEQAIVFANANKKLIARELVSPYTADEFPISVFMAGSPGAGKTEFSKNLLALLYGSNQRQVLRIDADEMRGLIPGYTGKNSHLYQAAASIIVEKMHDLALERKINSILDSTFTNYEKAIVNINRSLSKERRVAIFYVYQKPETAWKFTEAREGEEGRRIQKETFIEKFLNARHVVIRLRQKYDDEVRIYLVMKDFETNDVQYVVEITQEGRSLDHYLPRTYTRGELEKML